MTAAHCGRKMCMIYGCHNRAQLLLPLHCYPVPFFALLCLPHCQLGDCLLASLSEQPKQLKVSKVQCVCGTRYVGVGVDMWVWL